MKAHPFLIALCFFLVSCSVETELRRDSPQTVQDCLAAYLKGDYEAVYENSSEEMKSLYSEDVCLNILRFQDKFLGKMVKAELREETSGEYVTSVTDTLETAVTNIYYYTLENESGEKYDMSVQFLQGHLLGLTILPPDWVNEPAFVRNLVEPVEQLIEARDYHEFYELLDEQYPLSQIESVTQYIAEHCEGVPHRYKNYWTSKDKDGKALVAFEYAYEGKGYLECRFFIENDTYRLAGIHFTPKSGAKLP